MSFLLCCRRNKCVTVYGVIFLALSQNIRLKGIRGDCKQAGPSFLSYSLCSTSVSLQCISFKRFFCFYKDEAEIRRTQKMGGRIGRKGGRRTQGGQINLHLVNMFNLNLTQHRKQFRLVFVRV